mgnify:CR=1 FL=1
MNASQRRLEMTADRIEAVCASHKVGAKVVGGMIRPDGVVLLVSTNPPYDLRKLQSEIELSLGTPVTAFRDAIKLERMP